MAEAGRRGSIISTPCDGGEHDRTTSFNDEWPAARNLDLAEAEAKMWHFFAKGQLS
jgi:hypothetical protein